LEIPKEGLVRVNNAFIGMIVLIGEQNGPITVERSRIDGKSMILSGYKAAAGVRMRTRLIQSSVTIPCHTKHQSTLFITSHGKVR